MANRVFLLATLAGKWAGLPVLIPRTRDVGVVADARGLEKSKQNFMAKKDGLVVLNLIKLPVIDPMRPVAILERVLIKDCFVVCFEDCKANCKADCKAILYRSLRTSLFHDIGFPVADL